MGSSSSNYYFTSNYSNYEQNMQKNRFVIYINSIFVPLSRVNDYFVVRVAFSIVKLSLLIERSEPFNGLDYTKKQVIKMHHFLPFLSLLTKTTRLQKNAFSLAKNTPC